MARAGEGWFGRSEDGNDWDAQQISQMHGAGVIRQEQVAALELFDEFWERGSAAEVLYLSGEIA